MERKSFVLYTSSKKVIDLLDNEQTGILFKSVFEIVTNGKPLEMDGMTRVAFATIEDYLEKDFEAYQNKCEVNRKNGAKGGRPKGSNKKPKETEKTKRFSKKPNVTQKNIDIDSDIDTDIDTDIDKNIGAKHATKKTSSRFEPPTVEEVREYIELKGYSMDPEDFHDYYSASGWTLSNGRKMKDWKAAVNRWNRNQSNWGKCTTDRRKVEENSDKGEKYRSVFEDYKNI